MLHVLLWGPNVWKDKEQTYRNRLVWTLKVSPWIWSWDHEERAAVFCDFSRRTWWILSYIYIYITAHKELKCVGSRPFLIVGLNIDLWHGDRWSMETNSMVPLQRFDHSSERFVCMQKNYDKKHQFLTYY